MFALYRRHEKSCRHKAKGVRYYQCECPVWLDGYDATGKRVRLSLRTRSWTLAQSRLVEYGSGKTPTPAPPKENALRLDTAIRHFIEDCKARHLNEHTYEPYERILQRLGEFLDNPGINRITVENLVGFRAHRSAVLNAASAGKDLRVLRRFFNFAIGRKWTTDNPARAIKPPKVEQPPTLPFTREEVAKILAAVEIYKHACGPVFTAKIRARAKAIILTLLYSGLRISDCVALKRSAINLDTGRLMLRTVKTRESVYLTLHPAAVAALKALPVTGEYFFWNHGAKLDTAIGSAAKTIKSVLRLAGIQDGHAHRFRDTFSVSLLDSGVDIRRVQQLLGHTSIKTTEKHYAPWVASMQRGLDEAIAHLDFSGSLDTKPIMNASDDTSRDAEHNVLPFPARTKRA